MLEIQKQADKELFNKEQDIREKIRELHNTMDLLEKRAREICSERERIFMTSCFDKDVITRVLAYLVTLIQDELYIPAVTNLGFGVNINFPTPVNEKNKDNEYKLLYLVKESEQEAVKQEIGLRFRLDFEDQYKDADYINHGLNLVSLNYIQLAFFKGNDPLFNFLDEWDYDGIDWYDGKMVLRDEKFSYINDFMAMLVEHRINCPYEMMEEEMMNLAFTFANQYLSEKQTRN